MRAFAAFESMFATTHAIADAIADGLAPTHEVTASGGANMTTDLANADPVVVGGPAHAHVLSRMLNRRAAPDYVTTSRSQLTRSSNRLKLGPCSISWNHSKSPRPVTWGTLSTRLRWVSSEWFTDISASWAAACINGP